MSEVFEKYARRLLTNRLSIVAEIDVFDGNKSGAEGVKEQVFEDLRSALNNRPVTPDIVVTVEGASSLIIDAKYKPPRDVPGRSDINQVVLYGARYAHQRVMVFYAGRREGQSWVETVGNIGAHTLYTGYFDLAAEQIQDGEKNFINAIGTLLAV